MSNAQSICDGNSCLTTEIECGCVDVTIRYADGWNESHRERVSIRSKVTLDNLITNLTEIREELYGTCN